MVDGLGCRIITLSSASTPLRPKLKSPQPASLPFRAHVISLKLTAPAPDRKASLLTHPDRIDPTLPNLEQRRQEANERFSSVADAYFTLSDPTRRAAYDHKLRHAKPAAGMDGASYFDYFARATGQQRPEAEHVFGDVFEEMVSPSYSYDACTHSAV